MVKRDKANYLIQSVSHAIDVIEELCKSGAEIGVTELSKRLKLHKNNVFRLLATLELRGYVEQNQTTEDYRLGVRCLQLGQAFIQQSTLVNRAFPILKNAADALGETVSFATLQGMQVHFPITIEAKKSVKVASRAGVSLNAKAVSVGRLLLAQLPDSALSEILAGNTPQEAALKNQLNEFRTSGLLIDKGVTEPDVVTVARVVRGVNNEIVGAIEILIPQYRARMDVIQPVLDEAATALNQSLGSAAKGLVATIEKEISDTTSNKMPANIQASASTALLGRIQRA
jgi:IclR family KDG regulon transcriptional repressor